MFVEWLVVSEDENHHFAAVGDGLTFGGPKIITHKADMFTVNLCCVKTTRLPLMGSILSSYAKGPKFNFGNS
jgi:hypothetical protein